MPTWSCENIQNSFLRRGESKLMTIHRHRVGYHVDLEYATDPKRTIT